MMASIHSIVCYVSPSTSLKPFSGPRRPLHSPLLAHVYAMMNMLMGAIRAQAANDINNKALYDLAPMTYVGVVWFFISETMMWKTVRIGDIAFPFGLTAMGLTWMVVQRTSYVGS